MLSKMRTLKPCALLIALHTGLLAPYQSLALDDVLEEVVVVGELSTFGATKSKAPIAEIPRSVSIISSQEFIDRGALSLSNTLDYTAGAVGNAFGYATRGDFTSIRGLDAPEYQDNLQVLFGFYNNARADIYTLEQVEVLKGPASVLYGQAAPGGIVSTVSKVAGADKLGKEFSVSAGSHDRYQAGFDAGFDLSGDGALTARLVGLYRDSESQIDFVDDDALVLAPSLTYANDRSSVTLLLNYTDRESDTSAQFLPLTATACGSSSVSISDPNVCAATSGQDIDETTYVGDPNFNQYDTEATTVTLFGTHQINNYLTVEGTARYRDNEADYNQTWISFLGDGNPRTLADGTAVGRTWYTAPAGSEQSAFDVRLRANFETGAVTHDLLVGANYQDVETEISSALIYARATTFNIFNPIYDGSEIPTAAEFDAVRGSSDDETKATDLYITDTLFFNNFVVNAGVRFSSVESKDAVNDQDDDETPITFGVLYKTDFGLKPYVSYAESFRATVGTDVVTGSSLKPRRGEQSEIGLKYQSTSGRNFVSFAYFDLEEDNLVDFVAGGQTQPGLTIETEGFELEALVAWDEFVVDLNFRHINADDVDQNGVAVTRPSLPENTGSIWASWEPTIAKAKGLRIGFGARYASDNESNGTAFLAANAFAPTPIQIKTDGYTVFDMMIGYEFDSFDVALNVRNLNNKEYYSTCLSRGDCFPSEARTVAASLTKRF